VKIDWEYLLTILTIMMLVLLTVTVFIVGVARSASCLSIEVPPEAVVSQYDGDTFDVFTFGSPSSVRIRVQGVDTPERKGQQPGWEAAREFTRQWLAKGPFHINTCGKRTFERIEGDVTRGSDRLADALIAAGHGK